MGMKRRSEVGLAGIWDRHRDGILADGAQIRWNFSAQIASRKRGSDFPLDNQWKLINTVISSALIKHA
jgi:hypothetical protein